MELVDLLIADILFLIGIEGELTDRSNQSIDTQSADVQEQISQDTALVSFTSQRSQVDDQRTDSAQTPCQEKANNIHNLILPFFPGKPSLPEVIL